LSRLQRRVSQTSSRVKACSDQAETAGGSNILITHIPLARPERSQCGPNRESGRIQKGAGPGYQNLLGSETSRFLLDQLKPEVVFRYASTYPSCRSAADVVAETTMTIASIRMPGKFARSQSNLSHPRLASSGRASNFSRSSLHPKTHLIPLNPPTRIDRVSYPTNPAFTLTSICPLSASPSSTSSQPTSGRSGSSGTPSRTGPRNRTARKAD
jgi:hypothetical protein